MWRTVEVHQLFQSCNREQTTFSNSQVMEMMFHCERENSPFPGSMYLHIPLFVRKDVDRCRKTTSTCYKPQEPASIL